MTIQKETVKTLFGLDKDIKAELDETILLV
jgi:hypothetical protein